MCNDEVSSKNSWTDRDAVWHVGGVGPSNHVLDVSGTLPGEGAILGDFIPVEKHCNCLLRSPVISVLHFGPQSASVLISLKSIAGHIGPTIEMHIHSNSRCLTATWSFLSNYFDLLFFVQAIHQKIESLGFKDCHAKIRHVDCQETISNAVVIQVSAFILTRELV